MPCMCGNKLLFMEFYLSGGRQVTGLHQSYRLKPNRGIWDLENLHNEIAITIYMDSPPFAIGLPLSGEQYAVILSSV
jgi:hypothetical protein